MIPVSFTKCLGVYYKQWGRFIYRPESFYVGVKRRRKKADTQFKENKTTWARHLYEYPD